jgi:hypothetical protein
VEELQAGRYRQRRAVRRLADLCLVIAGLTVRSILLDALPRGFVIDD